MRASDQVKTPEPALPSGADTSALDGLGQRLGQVLMYLHLSQSELAQRMGMSSGFMSDVVRGQKKPGSEFLFGLRRQFGVSIDWLLTGEGAMLGHGAIDLELLRVIELYLALAYAAIIEGDVTAKALLILVRDDQLERSSADPEILAFLDAIRAPEDDLHVAAVLYNSQIGTSDPHVVRSNLMAAAIAHYEAQKPLNAMDALRRKVGGSVQINIGSTVYAPMGGRKS